LVRTGRWFVWDSTERKLNPSENNNYV
jgi:hypothetical protein